MIKDNSSTEHTILTKTHESSLTHSFSQYLLTALYVFSTWIVMTDKNPYPHGASNPSP